MPDQDVAELLSTRINCLEARFETRFDKLETRLDRWMAKNGDQNVGIQKNADQVEVLREIVDRRNKRFLTISVAIASCIATLLSALIQILIRFVFST